MNKVNRNLSFSFIVFFLLVFSGYAMAIDLHTAKQRGLVGETTSGYLQAVTTPNSEVKALIQDINQKRKQLYKEIAQRNGTTVAAVEKLAGKKAIERSKPGMYIKPGASWQKK